VWAGPPCVKRWEALGIVEMRKGSEAYLKVAFGPNLLHVPLILARPSKVKNLLQILQVRRALEGEAAAICAMSASDEDVHVFNKLTGQRTS